MNNTLLHISMEDAMRGGVVTIFIPIAVVAVHVLFCLGLFCYCRRKSGSREPRHEESLKRKMVAKFRSVWNPARNKESPKVDTLTRQQIEKVDCKENCTICLDGYDPTRKKDHALVGVVKKCGHYFHFDCMWEWLENHDSCPLCRGSAGLSENDIVGFPLKYVLDKLAVDKSKTETVSNPPEDVHVV